MAPEDRYRIFAEKIYPLLVEARQVLAAEAYCLDNGRVAVEPVWLMGVGLLQFLSRVPDRQAAELVRYHAGRNLAFGAQFFGMSGTGGTFLEPVGRWAERFREHGVRIASICVGGDVAGAFFLHRVDRVGPARRTIRLVFDVGSLPEQVGIGGDGGRGLLVFDCPLQLGAINVPAVDGTGPLLGFVDGVAEVGNGDGRQDADDGHYDHDFNEGESGVGFGFHCANACWS